MYLKLKTVVETFIYFLDLLDLTEYISLKNSDSNNSNQLHRDKESHYKMKERCSQNQAARH